MIADASAMNARSDADAVAPLTVLGADTHMKGEMHFNGPAQILGTFEGRILSKSEVHVGATALCKASIEAARVVVDGTVEGDITAHERAELHPTACVTGDLSARALVVEEGAVFTGNFRVGVEPVAQVKQGDRLVEKRATSAGGMATVETRGVRVATRGGATSGRGERIAVAAAELADESRWVTATA